jgi:hypothetical protein
MERTRLGVLTGVLIATLIAGLGAVFAPVAPVRATAVQTACGPSSPAGWQAMFAALPTFGDGNISVRLDASRCAVLTGDAMPRESGPWAHSTITVIDAETARVLKPAYPNTASPYQAIPDRGDGTVDWLGPSFVAGTTLYSLAPRVRPITSGWEVVGVNIAVFDVPAGGDPAGMPPRQPGTPDRARWPNRTPRPGRIADRPRTTGAAPARRRRPQPADSRRPRRHLDTVKKHITHVLGKLGAANRTEAVTRARQLGLIT